MKNESKYIAISSEEGSEVEMTSVPQSWEACMMTAGAWLANFRGLTITIVESLPDLNAPYEEYVMVLQGRHSGYRFGSDRIANARQFLARNAALLVDFESKELHPETVAAVREEARGYIPGWMHCKNCLKSAR